MRRGWVRRATALVIALVCLFALLRLVDRDPDPVRLALLGAVVALAGWLILDTFNRTTLPSVPDLREDDATPRESAVDGHTDSLVRLIENHQQSHDPDRRLHDRLVNLAEQRLAQRYGVRLAEQPARAEALLGADAFDRLTGTPHRYTLTDIEGILLRIEDL